MGLLNFAKDIGKKLFNREEEAPEKISAYIEEDNPGVSDLKVDVKDGVVTLKGTVDSFSERELCFSSRGCSGHRRSAPSAARPSRR